MIADEYAAATREDLLAELESLHRENHLLLLCHECRTPMLSGDTGVYSRWTNIDEPDEPAVMLVAHWECSDARALYDVAHYSDPEDWSPLPDEEVDEDCFEPEAWGDWHKWRTWYAARLEACNAAPTTIITDEPVVHLDLGQGVEIALACNNDWLAAPDDDEITQVWAEVTCDSCRVTSAYVFSRPGAFVVDDRVAPEPEPAAKAYKPRERDDPDDLIRQAVALIEFAAEPLTTGAIMEALEITGAIPLKRLVEGLRLDARVELFRHASPDGNCAWRRAGGGK